MPTQQIGQKKFIRDMGKDWINGYIFSWLETKYKDAIKYHADDFVLEIPIPKSWFGLQCAMSDTICLSDDAISEYLNELEDVASVFCKKWRIKEAEMLPEEDWENFMRRAFNDDYETYQYLTDVADNNF